MQCLEEIRYFLLKVISAFSILVRLGVGWGLEAGGAELHYYEGQGLYHYPFFNLKMHCIQGWGGWVK